MPTEIFIGVGIFYWQHLYQETAGVGILTSLWVTAIVCSVVGIIIWSRLGPKKTSLWNIPSLSLLFALAVAHGFFVDVHTGPLLLTQDDVVADKLPAGRTIIVRQGENIRGLIPVNLGERISCRAESRELSHEFAFGIELTLIPTKEGFPGYFATMKKHGTPKKLCESVLDEFLNVHRSDLITLFQKHKDDPALIERDYFVQKLIQSFVGGKLRTETNGGVVFRRVVVPGRSK